MRQRERFANPSAVSRRTAVGVIAAGAAWLHGCGGGGGAAGIASLTSGGTGSFTTGTVSGLGSIIVNGVRYDDRTASVSRSDDDVVGAIHPGMVVAIQATTVTAAPAGATLGNATALRIVYSSEWVGRIDALDPVARTITVLGQTVEIPAAAVIEGAATQLSALAIGQVVEVHGYLALNASRLVATRIEVTTSPRSTYRLSGLVSALDTATRTFRLGTAVVSFDATVVLPSGIGNGSLVRVVLGTTQIAGAWPAQRIRARELLLAAVRAEDRDEARIEGTVTAFTSASNFAANGVSIDASGLPPTTGLALGALVEVEGTLRNGVLIASKVQVEDRSALETEDFRFIGTATAVDLAARTFTLQGQQFSYGVSTRIEVPNWVSGATPTVEVRAGRVGGQWFATEIKVAR